MAVRKRHRAIQRMQDRPLFIKMLVYGDPGSGKTVLAGTSPSCLFLNADGPDGVESARHQGSKADVWDMASYKDLDDAYNFLRQTDHPYEWVWLDSISLFQELGMDQIMAEVVAAKPHRDPYVPDRLEYVKNMTHLSKWVRHMKALPFNFGVTAHVLRVEDDEDGEVTYMPWIQGRNMPSKICGYMSVVGRLYVASMRKEGTRDKTQVRILQTERQGKWYAKDRFDRLGARVVEPTVPKIVAAVKNSETPRRARSGEEAEVRRERKRPRTRTTRRPES